MKFRHIARAAGCALVFTAIAACAQEASTPAGVAAAGAEPASAAGPAPLPESSSALPLVVVHKTPTCGCCGLWVDHVREAGFPVEVHDMDDLGPVKQRLGIPYGKGSCHTAEVDGYAIEGHVPAQDIKRLLAERPEARGLVLPGMPMGSPGMEMPDGRSQPYMVELVRPDGSTEAFASH